MDASASLGDLIGSKSSSAYAPPECQYSAQRKQMLPIPAEKSFDIWSLGVIIFELCAGEKLFRQDMCNDELAEDADRTRLQVWHTADDEVLEPVFALAEAEATDQHKQDAKSLIRWCLKGNREERPTVQEMLDHPFLADHTTKAVEMPMKYFGFLSHSQIDASGTVSTLYHLCKQKGLHCWIDMRQKVLTLEGMRQGVRDSDTFMLVLTEHVLNSWYVQQEILCAIQEGKPIQLIVEADPRFHPFDVTQWISEHDEEVADSPLTRSSGSFSTKNERDEKVLIDVKPDTDDAWQMQHKDDLTTLITEAIDKSLPEAITYRRRDFEQDAMLRELCRRNGRDLPDDYEEAATAVRDVRVLVIHNPKTSGELFAALLKLQVDEEITMVDGPRAISEASDVLLLLTEGVIAADALASLQAVIAHDRQQKVDRIVCVFDAASWDFRSQEAQKAPDDVKACLSKHEAITFRPADGGANRHEHAAMVKQLLEKLRVERV